MADFVYNGWKLGALKGTSGYDLDSNSDIYALLIDSTSTYTPAHTDKTLADLKAASGFVELSTTGYTEGGTNIVGATLTEDDTDGVIKFTVDDPEWSALGPASSGPTVLAIVLYIKGASDSLSFLVTYKDSGGSIATNGGSVTFEWDSTATDGVVFEI
jgi:hypothetical protein